MPEEIVIPGYLEAVADEQRERSFAWLGLPELIAGVKVQSMTPLNMDWLRALRNPFVSREGNLTKAASIQFLWVLQSDFDGDGEKLKAFAETHRQLDMVTAISETLLFLDRTFMDSPKGPDAIPYYSPSAFLVREMSREPYRWDYKVTLRTSFRVLYQLMRSEYKSQGGVIFNKKSDGIRDAWLNDAWEKAWEAMPEDEKKKLQ